MKFMPKINHKCLQYLFPLKIYFKQKKDKNEVYEEENCADVKEK